MFFGVNFRCCFCNLSLRICRCLSGRWFYRQIRVLYSTSNEAAAAPVLSVFEYNPKSSKLCLRETVSIHMYISTAPCGDASAFAIEWVQPGFAAELRCVRQMTWNDRMVFFLLFTCLQCFDAVGWATGRASGLQKTVVGCWCGYLSGARCRLAYGPADAIATHRLLLH